MTTRDPAACTANRLEKRMSRKDALTAAYVRSILDYDPETGVFRWKARTPDMFRYSPVRSTEHKCENWNSRYAGTVAGTVWPRGYRVISIGGILFPAGRLAWFYMNGEWPKEQIDHVNGNRSDDRLVNLRQATRSENNRNKPAPSCNTSGYKGVTFDRSRGRWRAQIQLGRKGVHLGYFDAKEDAAAAYERAAREHHGEFARTT